MLHSTKTIAVLLSIFFSLSACSSTKQVTSNKIQKHNSELIAKKILVVYLNNDRITRTDGENKMIKILKALGYDASAFSDSPLSKKALDNKEFTIFSSNYGAILCIMPASKEVENYIHSAPEFIPPTRSLIPNKMHSNPLDSQKPGNEQIETSNFSSIEYANYIARNNNPRLVKNIDLNTCQHLFYQADLYKIKPTGEKQLVHSTMSEAFHTELPPLTYKLCRLMGKSMQKEGLL